MKQINHLKRMKKFKTDITRHMLWLNRELNKITISRISNRLLKLQSYWRYYDLPLLGNINPNIDQVYEMADVVKYDDYAMSELDIIIFKSNVGGVLNSIEDILRIEVN